MDRRRLLVASGALMTALVLTLGLVGYASAAPGGEPRLTVSGDALRAALDCHGDLAGGPAAPVLLVPGTTLDPDVNFDWNYLPALRSRGLAVCTVRLPGDAMGDIQVAAEYVVHALRAMHERAGRPVDVVGFSQGGMVPRWVLKFWPSTRGMVDDVVGIDPSHHGTLDAHPVCAPGCAPAFWQQRTGSAFLTALNAGGETYAGIDYTQVFTATDEVVAPNLPPVASSALHTGSGRIANILVQDVCPGHVAEHLTMGSTDPVGYATVLDAIGHDGPARLGRIDRGSCLRPTMPGVDPLTLPANEARYHSHIALVLATYPHVAAEPKLRPYAADERS